MLPAVRKYENSSGGQGRAFGLVGYFCFSAALVHKTQLIARTKPGGPGGLSQWPDCGGYITCFSILGGGKGIGGQMPTLSCKSRDKAVKIQGVRLHDHEYSGF